jgi:hypothetical protein
MRCGELLKLVSVTPIVFGKFDGHRAALRVKIPLKRLYGLAEVISLINSSWTKTPTAKCAALKVWGVPLSTPPRTHESVEMSACLCDK